MIIIHCAVSISEIFNETVMIRHGIGTEAHTVTVETQCTLSAFVGKSPGQAIYLSHFAAKFLVSDITW